MTLNRKDFIKTLGLTVGSSALGGFSWNRERIHPRIFPHTLQRGDTLGMVSPASSLADDAAYDSVADDIKELGFKVQIGEYARNHHGYFAGKDKERAADLNTMFANPDIDGILPFRGGWGANRILGHLDFDVIRDNPKPLIGYSDITSLLLAIYARTGLVTFHGPVGKSSWTDFTQHYFQDALMSGARFQMENKKPEGDTEVLTTIHGGKAEGTLLGGNLTVLTSMLGSAYLPDWNNALLFVEDVGEDVYRIDRMLTQLKLNGIFDKINGFIFGRCTNCEVSEGRHFTLEQIVDNHIKPYEIPAYVGANIGHIEDMFTLPVGVRAEMDATTGSIELLEAATS